MVPLGEITRGRHLGSNVTCVMLLQLATSAVRIELKVDEIQQALIIQ